MVEFDPEVMKVKICPKCKGLGGMVDAVNNMFKCDRCDGAGRIIEKVLKNDLGLDEIKAMRPFEPDEMKVKICRHCKGLGYTKWGADDVSCEECRGDGRYIEHKIVTEYRLAEVDGIPEAGK